MIAIPSDWLQRLTPTEADVLRFMARHPNARLSHLAEELECRVRTARFHIASVAKKIAPGEEGPPLQRVRFALRSLKETV